MKKIIFVLLMLVSAVASSQPFETRTLNINPRYKDTIFFTNIMYNNAMIANTNSQDSIIIYKKVDSYPPEETTYKYAYAIYSQRNGIGIYISSWGGDGRFITNRNDLTSFHLYAPTDYSYGYMDTLDLSQARLLRRLLIDSIDISSVILNKNKELRTIKSSKFSDYPTYQYPFRGYVDLRNNEKLDTIKLAGSFSKLWISNNTQLDRIEIYSDNLYDSLFLSAPNSDIKYVNIDARCSTAKVDEILKWCVDGGSSNGLCDLCYYLMGVPSATGVASANTLISRGWEVCYRANTESYSTPTVTTYNVSNVSETTVTGGGVITFDGNSSVYQKGLCWSTSINPTTANSNSNNGSGVSEFSHNITGLTANTTYYVRAYAINSTGTGYGGNIIFTTLQDYDLPEVWTSVATGITATTATAGGNITWDGGAAVTARGVCWNTTGTLDELGSNYTTNGTGTGTFASSLTGLSANTTYYFQAYATNSEGTNFGSQGTFTTPATGTLPTVYTNPITSVEYGVAYGGGEVTNQGSANVTIKGVCWSTSPNPTIANQVSYDGSGLGSYVSSIYNIDFGNILYYVRAYATNSVGTAYGEEVYFVTRATPSPPVVSTTIATVVGTTTATSGGYVSDSGSEEVTARGVVVGISNTPTISSYTVKTSDGTGIGAFSSSIAGLTNSTLYYYRAYATNLLSTSYGDTYSFTTGTAITKPVVTTTTATSIADNSATAGGNITSDGGNSVTARGVCFSISPNFTSETCTSNGTGTGTFTSSLTNLETYRLYYYRAYATNSAGTAYGEIKSFTTTGQFIPKYGYIYNWYAGVDSRKISSSDDFIVPSADDFKILADYLGANGNYLTNGIGFKLKETDYVYWNYPNTGATNEVGFNARGNGGRSDIGQFYSLKVTGWWMTTTEWSATQYYMAYVTANSIKFIVAGAPNKKVGVAIRLLKTSTSLSHGQTGRYVGNDGKVYATICIGTQEWVSLNLSETKYRNGDTITTVTDPTEWSLLSTGGKCAFLNDESNVY